LVGGSVRDLMLGVSPSDWDIATDLTPGEVLGIFPGASTVGMEFGRLSLGDIDVVSLRAETDYRDRRHPEKVRFGVPLEKDLGRRDFTVNAMALDPFSLELIDPFGGKEDLNLGILRTVGGPLERFTEDPLRILRAIRLKSVLGFSLDPDILRALSGTKDLLREISPERVFMEIKSILLSGSVYEGVMDLYRLGLGETIDPGVFREPFEPLALALSHSQKDLPERLAILFSEVPENAVDSGSVETTCSGPLGSAVGGQRGSFEQFSRRFNLPESFRREVQWLIANGDPSSVPDPGDLSSQIHLGNYWKESEPTLGFTGLHLADGRAGEVPAAPYLVRRILYQLGEETLMRMIDMKWALWKGRGNKGIAPGALFLISGLNEAKRNPYQGKLAVDGEDVMNSLGLSPGPLVGEALQHLEEIGLKEPALNQKAVLLRILGDWWKKHVEKK